MFHNSLSLFCFTQIVILMLAAMMTSRKFTLYAVITTKTYCFHGWNVCILKNITMSQKHAFKIYLAAVPSPRMIPTVSKTHWLFFAVFNKSELSAALGSVESWLDSIVPTVLVYLWILKYFKSFEWKLSLAASIKTLDLIAVSCSICALHLSTIWLLI